MNTNKLVELLGRARAELSYALHCLATDGRPMINELAARAVVADIDTFFTEQPTDYMIHLPDGAAVVFAYSFDDAADQFRRHGYDADVEIACLNSRTPGSAVFTTVDKQVKEAKRLPRVSAVSLDDFYWGVVALAHKDYDEHDKLWHAARLTGATSEQIMAVYTPASILNDIVLFREYPSRTLIHYIEKARAAGIAEDHIERALNCSTPPIKWNPPPVPHQPTFAEGYDILVGPDISAE